MICAASDSFRARLRATAVPTASGAGRVRLTFQPDVAHQTATPAAGEPSRSP